MGVIPLKKNQWTAIKILFQTSLSPLGVYSYMEVTKSVQDGIVGSTDRLSLNLTDKWPLMNDEYKKMCHFMQKLRKETLKETFS